MAEPTNHDLIVALRKEVEKMREERSRAKAEKEKQASGPQIEANNFKLGIPLINRVEQNAFAGRDTEDTNRHLTKFVEIANTIKINGVDDDIVRVRLFPFSLTDAAKEWYDCLPADKTKNWKDLVVLFLDKYYPPGTILKLKCEIFQFIQGSDEPLYEALARFKALLRKFPNHGFGIDHQVGILYNGFNEKISSLLDSGANGGFLRKGGVVAMEVIEELATNSRGWSKEKHKAERLDAVKKPCGNETSQELAFIRARLEKLEAPGKEGNAIKDVKYVQNGGDPNRLYNNNYRPNQGGGFNLGKEKGMEPPTKEDKYEAGIQKILELMLEDRKNNETKMGVVEERLTKLESGLNTVVSTMSIIKLQMDQFQKKAVEDKGKAVAKVVGINKDEASISGRSFGDCPTPSGPPHTLQRAATGAQFGSCPTSGGPPQTPQRPATEEAEAPAKIELVRHNGIVLPFQPRKPFKLEEQFQQFLNMFCKCHTNLPLVDALQEIPRYAKLLREAVMKKQKLQKSDLKLPLHCSDIIQKQRTVKQRDPGQFIIRCSIGNGKVDKALCDLGASVNIMPLEYYEKLNIEPLKSTDTCLRMADNTAVNAVRVIEDVLVKVDYFIFPADFFVLDMKVDTQVPLILGRNFLATCKALIDVGKGEITISDHRGKSTYNIESMMLKYEEAKQAKMEHDCREVMVTDLSKPYDPFGGEDLSNPTIFIVNTLPQAPKKGEYNPTKPTLQEKPKRKKRKKTPPQDDPKIYVIKTSNGKFKWWKKVFNKLVPLAVAETKIVGSDLSVATVACAAVRHLLAGTFC
ncbi:uncharacterized protein LOC125194921 [Salvia hispanica]|uniref:uncharacterized protein LOC125194921 n=1 Tax=Salvia hispanica TaxID=49212 RepID=UPI002009341F|nr:uncharacterized protein LOC125194921 [Salvia hispanica]